VALSMMTCTATADSLLLIQKLDLG
jgi:hypothetical protein